MLKRRIIPIELLMDNRLVKTAEFRNPRDVGDPVMSSKVYSAQDADELLLLLIDRTNRQATKLVDVVKRIAEHCFVPLTVGGGIASIEDAAILIAAGADKVMLNSIAYDNPEVIAGVAERFGRQAVVVGIDVRRESDEYVLFSDCGRERQSVSLAAHIEAVTSAGAGELILQAIDHDGIMRGYDLELIRQAKAICRVPLIAAAGAGHFLHLKEAFDAGVDAAACGSLFNFGDNSPLRAKAFLKNHGIPLKKI